MGFRNRKQLPFRNVTHQSRTFAVLGVSLHASKRVPHPFAARAEESQMAERLLSVARSQQRHRKVPYRNWSTNLRGESEYYQHQFGRNDSYGIGFDHRVASSMVLRQRTHGKDSR